MKRLLLELGGKGACIVFDDANLDAAVGCIGSTWSFHSGQICTAPTRAVVQRGVFDQVVEVLARLRRARSRWATPPSSTPSWARSSRPPSATGSRATSPPAATRAPSSSPAAAAPRTSSGASTWSPPCSSADNDMAVAREEIFGPVRRGHPLRRRRRGGVAIANDSDFGLYDYVFSGDTARAFARGPAPAGRPRRHQHRPAQPRGPLRRLQDVGRRARRRRLRPGGVLGAAVDRLDRLSADSRPTARPARGAEERHVSTYDLAIMGGIVVDGTGLARRRGDIAVKDGRIAKIGFVDPADADQVIDADGLHVAPGIVDAHTHYDPQLTFEPHATSSCYHGVTTVLAGNCGFSVAPNRPDQRDYLARMFAKVEGMSPVALSAVQVGLRVVPRVPGRRGGEARGEHGLLRRALGRAPHRHGRGRVRARGHRRRDRADARAWWPRPWRPGRRASRPRTARPSSTGTNAPSPAASRRWPSSRCCAPRRAVTGAARSATSTAAPSAGSTRPTRTCSCASAPPAGCPSSSRASAGAPRSTCPGPEWEQVSQWIDEVGREGRRASSPCCATIPSTATSASTTGTNLYEGCPSWHTRRRARAWRTRSARPAGATRAGATRCATPSSTRTPTGPRDRPCRRRAGASSRSTRWLKPAQREVRAAHHRRHRRRARQGARRRAPRPGARRGPAHRLPLRQQEPGVGGGGGRRPEPPRHDHRRVRRRGPSRPRRRLGLVDGIPGLLGARPQAVEPRGGDPPAHAGAGRAARLRGPGHAPARATGPTPSSSTPTPSSSSPRSR